MNRKEKFVFDKEPEEVVFVETMQVVDGIECDVYSINGDNNKDLGIIRVDVNSKTPLQKVVKGERTIEGHIAGEGFLVISKVDGDEEIYPVFDDVNQEFSLDVGIGEIMQGVASENSSLTLFEICIPPYQEGRFDSLKINDN